MPKISVIVPVYNVENYIYRCLNSLMNQTADDYEVIVVNDGTKDHSQNIIDEFVEKSSVFKCYIKENGGLSDARNYGIQRAAGEYLLFVDADDFVEPNLIERCLNQISQYDVLIFEYKQIFENSGKNEIIHNKFEENKIYSLNTNPEILCNINNCAWNKCYRKDLFNDIEYPKGYLYEDLGTTYLLLDKCEKIGFINEPLLDYIQDREGNITGSVSPKLFDIFAMCQKNIDYFKNKSDYKKYAPHLQILCKQNITECLRKLRFSNDLNFSFKFVDEAFDFMKCNFESNINLAKNKMDYIYESKFLLKTYLFLKGAKNGKR